MKFLHYCIFKFQFGHIFLHAFMGSGFLHPLTGVDHMVAMISVGAWSAQLGRRYLITVPLAFLVMMCIGGTLGVFNITVPYTESGIVLSVLLLGFAIVVNQTVGRVLAALAVGVFGLCHGYAHGKEIPLQLHVPLYIFGFLVTTLFLHIVGAVGGLLLLEEQRGALYLRAAGGIVFMVGIYLLIKSLLLI